MVPVTEYLAPWLAANWSELLGACTPVQRCVLVHTAGLWLRPEQVIVLGPWRVHGTIAGRGWGKTHGYAVFINEQVAFGGVTRVGLMGPTEKVVSEVQVRALIATAPPWNVPTAYLDHIEWPNGAVAFIYSAAAPEKARGQNLELSWCTELVAWGASTRRAAWRNMQLSTRIGIAKMLFDTTSSGRNALILDRLADHEREPETYPLVRGTTFDNPLLSEVFLDEIRQTYVPDSRAYKEEILGHVFTEASTALWQQEWIDAHRREVVPSDPAITILAADPAMSENASADEMGLVLASRDHGGDIYVLDDLSGHLTLDAVGDLIVKHCLQGAAGVVIEGNNGGKGLVGVLNVICRTKGLSVSLIESDKPIPPRRSGVIYVRLTTATRSKEARAEAPARLYSQGRVHHVGLFDLLESELTTWEPDATDGGRAKSPNRLDALVYAVAELGGVAVYGPMRQRPTAAEAEQAQTLLRAGLVAQPRGVVDHPLLVRDPRISGRGRTI